MKKQGGFSLLEILIAMVVITIAMLSFLKANFSLIQKQDHLMQDNDRYLAVRSLHELLLMTNKHQAAFEQWKQCYPLEDIGSATLNCTALECQFHWKDMNNDWEFRA